MEFLKNIKLERPIVFYDLETTGTNPSLDKIVSIGCVKINVDGSTESKYTLVNPTIPIPSGASAVHNIRDEDVVGKPTFQQLSKAMYAFFEGCDIAGYNSNRFDNALLQEEFFRCGIDFPNPQNVLSIDAYTIFTKFEKRDLASALKFYCNEKMEDAHNAEADNKATIKVFGGQLDKYDELKGKSVKELSELCKDDNRADWAGRIIKDENGEYVFNFGNAIGTKVKDNRSFANWCLTKDFPETFKNLLRKILE